MNDGKWIQSGSYTGQHQETVDAQLAALRPLDDEMKKRLLEAREAVWRAWFAAIGRPGKADSGRGDCD
jgi:uncharacterized protein with beta-barrel porin domain